MSDAQIYYAEGSERRGPVSINQLAAMNISPDTYVWYQGLDNWTPASQAPLTAHLFASKSAPRYGAPTPQYGAPQGQPMRPQYPSKEPSFAPGGYDRPPSRPDTYLVWAILTTLFCCLPFGIVSIVYASQVNSYYNNGQYDSAIDASRKAKKWAMWSALSSIIIAVLYILFYVILGAAVLSLPY